MGVAASSEFDGAPRQTGVPEPPAYTACVAHLQAIEPKPAKGQKAKTPAALKAECEEEYKALQQPDAGLPDLG